MGDSTEDSIEEPWEFPLRSAARLVDLMWCGPGVAVLSGALEVCKMLTSVGLNYSGDLVHSDIRQWPRILELTRLDLLDKYTPGGPYFTHPFTRFTK